MVRPASTKVRPCEAVRTYSGLDIHPCPVIPEAAEFFAGGGRDSRIYSVEIPKDRVLDFTKDSQRWSKVGAWGPVKKKIEDTGKKGKYDAIAIHDVTFGSDEPGVPIAPCA